jgi:hypothetical protein
LQIYLVFATFILPFCLAKLVSNIL